MGYNFNTALRRMRWFAISYYMSHVRHWLWRIESLRGLINYFDSRRLGNKSDQDDQENRKTTPPDNEKVKLQALWAVEFYTPSQVEKLFAGIRKLGWANDPIAGTNLEAWIRRGRQSGTGGGWLNLGIIKRKGSKIGWPESRSAQLPGNVEYATGAALTVTSSLTCVILQFVFTERFSDCYDIELRKKRKYATEPIGGGTAMLSPTSQKMRAVEAIRLTVRRDAWNWFRKNLGGVFSAEDDFPEEFPAFEMITTSVTTPFPGGDDTMPPERGFLQVLGIDFSFNAWKSKDEANFRFSPSVGPSQRYAVIVSLESCLSIRSKANAMGGDRGGIVYYANSRLQNFLIRWSISDLLSNLQQIVNRTRDSTIFRADSPKHTMSVISKLIDIESRGLDVASISTDLRAYTEDPFFLYDVGDFEPIDKLRHRTNSLVNGLRLQIAKQTKLLETTDQDVRRSLAQQGTLLATRENIRLQERMDRLTKWIIGLTVVGVIAAIAVPLIIAMEADPAGKVVLQQWKSTLWGLGASVIAFLGQPWLSKR